MVIPIQVIPIQVIPIQVIPIQHQPELGQEAEVPDPLRR